MDDLKLLKALKNKILSLAMQGKLVKQDENDEPASILLEKIKKEKAELLKQGKLKKEKELPPIKADEVPYELPKSWKWVRLGEVCEINKKTLKADTDPLYSFSYIDISSVREGKIYFTNNKILFKNAPSRARRVIRQNDVIISTVRPNLKAFAYIDFAIKDTIVSTGFAVLSPKDIIFTKYLYYLFYTELLSNQISQVVRGTSYPAMTIDDMEKFIFPLPPLAEQERIVAKIEEIFAIIDEIEKNITENKKLSKVLYNKLLSFAMQGKLVKQDENDEPASILLEKIKKEKAELLKQGKIKKEKELPPIKADEVPYELPKSWQWVRLGEVGLWGSGSTPNRMYKEYYINGVIPWIKTGELNDGYINKSIELITEKAVLDSSLTIYPKGSLVIAMYGATIGKLGILNIDATTNQACCVCQSYIGYNKYLFYYLISERKNLRIISFGGAQPNISKEKIINYLFPLPPLAEQERIVAKIEEIKEIIDEIG